MGISLSLSTLAALELTGFPLVPKLTKNEAVSLPTVGYCRHSEVMVPEAVCLNSYLALFLQVYKGEFQLPEFLKEKPQVLYWFSPLDV